MLTPRGIVELARGRWRLHCQARERRQRLEVEFRQSETALRKLIATLPKGRRIRCIGLTEHMGDIIACEPVASYLRATEPDAWIVWIVNRQYEELVRDHPSVDSTLLVSSLSEYLRLVQAFPSGIFVDLHVVGRRCQTYGLVQRKRTGNPAITVDNYYLHGSLLESFSLSAGLPRLTDAPRLHLPNRTGIRDQQAWPQERFVVIHARPNDRTREWPLEKWAEFCRQFQAASRLPMVEIGREPAVAAICNSVLFPGAPSSFASMSELIARSAGFVGIDSGPAHLANALCSRSLVLMGHLYKIRRYSPYTGFLREHDSEMIIRWDGPIADLPVDIVLNRALALFQDNQPQTSAAR